MDYYKAVAKLFDHFNSKVFKSSYRIDLDKNNHRRLIDNFVKLLASQFGLHSIGYNTLLDCFQYSFFYWNGKKTKRQLSLNWIIGRKTVTRWLEKKDGTQYHIDNFIKEYDIDINLLKQQLAEQDNQEEQPILNPAEELEKTRFKGAAQLYHCSQFTTLYHHKSIICLKCGNRAACKKLLKDTKPRLFSKRGYVKDERVYD